MKIQILKLSILILVSFLVLSMTLVKKNYQDSWQAPVEYQNINNPYVGVDDEDRIGRTLYSKHCKFCHGKTGKGDGNQANLLQTPVADFTTDAFKSQTDGSIYYKLFTGRNEMPGFEKVISDEEDFWMVINYIKTF